MQQLWRRIKNWNRTQVIIIGVTVSITLALAGICRWMTGISSSMNEVKATTETMALTTTAVLPTAIAVPAQSQSTDGTGKTITHAGEITKATERPPNKDKVEVISHTITSGESLWTISKKYNVTTPTILAANPKLDPHVLQPGKTIRVPNRTGLFFKVARNQSLTVIAKTYKIKVDDILRVNDITSVAMIKSGDTIFLPGDKPLQIALNIHSGFINPVPGGRLTSGFGYRQHPMGGGSKFHTGLDIAAQYGVTVVAADSGRVVEAGWHGLLGKAIVIRHSKTYETLYGHNSYLLVHPGDYVGKGQPIARVGTTGMSTGPHVHFELHKNGQPINPLPYLR